ncbi:MAG: helix-turn-helix domain-containing protein [Acidobacteria bacterium]|nr:helix-turn-helix domain-containing protein [Acidobacteriota bacterium]
MPDAELPEDRSSLREARERRGRSLEEIADTTKISVSALEALERYDASSLPGGIFTRAFVRSYATEVGLDPETALREFLARCPEADPVEVVGSGEASAPRHLGLGGSRPIGLRLALLAAPLIALGVFVGVRACDDRASARVSDSEAQAVAEASAAASPARRAPPETTVPVMPPPVEGAPLVMEVFPSRDCWVAATVDGEAAMSRLMRAGERQTLRAVEAITVNVGDAGAFEYTLNEEPGRLLGGRGQVVTETFTPDNYRDYLIP